MLGKKQQTLNSYKFKLINSLTDYCVCVIYRDDMEMMLNKIVPEGLPYRHSCEGPDDMVSR